MCESDVPGIHSISWRSPSQDQLCCVKSLTSILFSAVYPDVTSF